MEATTTEHLNDGQLMQYVLKLEDRPKDRELARDHLADCESCRSRAERLRLDLSSTPAPGTPEHAAMQAQAKSVAAARTTRAPLSERTGMMLGLGLGLVAALAWILSSGS